MLELPGLPPAPDAPRRNQEARQHKVPPFPIGAVVISFRVLVLVLVFVVHGCCVLKVGIERRKLIRRPPATRSPPCFPARVRPWPSHSVCKAHSPRSPSRSSWPRSRRNRRRPPCLAPARR